MTMMQNTQPPAETLEDWLAAETSAGRLSGGVLEVADSGGVTLQCCFGQRGAEDPTPVTPETVYWIASMTKPVTCVLALTLVEAGLLALDQPLGDIIPEFAHMSVLGRDGQAWPARNPIRIVDLMRHTSGVTYGAFGDRAIHRAYEQARVYDFDTSNAEMAQRLSQLPLVHEPGYVFEYGMSTDLLGAAVEAVLGQPLDRAMRERIFDPLGMAHTGFHPDPAHVAEPPDAAALGGLVPPLSPAPRWLSGGGGLWSTAGDYMKFARMLLRGGEFETGRLLRPETVALMADNHLPAGVGYGDYTPELGITAPGAETGLGFGLGVATSMHREHPLDPLCAGYLWPGVSGANFWVDPHRDQAVVLMTHAPAFRQQHRIALRRVLMAMD